MKKTTKKLALNAETVRLLGSDTLEGVVGGALASQTCTGTRLCPTKLCTMLVTGCATCTQ